MINDTSTFFIVIEGLDGSGKSEITRRLSLLIAEQLGNDRVLFTYEPHDPSVAGDYIRAVLRQEFAIAPRTLALAYALNRADHNDRMIAPFFADAAPEAPRVCVCDRYYLSSLVYNTTPDFPIQMVMAINGGARRPDLTIFLDASAETCYARMGNRGGAPELFESKLDEKRARYHEAMQFLANLGETIAVVDANLPLLDVLNAAVQLVNENAPPWLRLPLQTEILA